MKKTTKKSRKEMWGVILSLENSPFISRIVKLRYVPSIELWEGLDGYLVCKKPGIMKRSSKYYTFSSSSKKEVEIWASGAETFKTAISDELMSG